MRRAYLLVFLPALVVGIAYVVVFRRLGMEIQLGPFAGAALALAAAIWLVRRRQRRGVKQGR